MSKDKNITGPNYWQSPNQLLDSPDYRRRILDHYREINADSVEANEGMSRRKFLALMGASIAMASMAGCRKPVEKIVPYVIQPEEVVPGIPAYYATTMPLGSHAYGLVIECHEGRPTKIEGNPLHPSTLGSSNVYLQAATLNLYDPDRSKMVRRFGAEDEYANFVSFWRTKYEKFRNVNGRGLAVLAEPFASPTLARLREDFMKQFPEALWMTYEPVSDENIYQAIENATSKRLNPVYHYDKASVILALDADFLGLASESITAARGFAAGRRLEDRDGRMSRLYVVENAFTITGGSADHRLRLPSGRIADFVKALMIELKGRGLELNITGRPTDDFDREWLGAVAGDLMSAQGKSIVVVGSSQPAWVTQLALQINTALQNMGNTITFNEIRDATLSRLDDLKQLAGNAAAIDTLIIAGGNPVYDAPADLDLKGILGKIKHSVHLSSHFDETSSSVEWHIPRAHFLESWGDARAIDGTLSVVQPAIEPLYGGHADTEFYALLSSGRDLRGYEAVRETWTKILGAYDFEKNWRKVLHDGVLKNSSAPDIEFKLLKKLNVAEGKDAGNDLGTKNIEIAFYPSQLYDGRFANNGWLQELPDAVTRLAWDNAALVSPKTARELGVTNFEIVRISIDNRSLEIPAWIVPGQADYTIALSLGYGRQMAGRVGNNVGFNSYALRTTDNYHFAHGAKVISTGRNHRLANVQDHSSMEGRPIIREAGLEKFRENPGFAKDMVEHPPLKSIYPDHDYGEGYQWGMVIDLNTCTGCNACVIACQSENNIQIVGKEQVEKGREMHWIRNDRYFSGTIEEPEMVHMPVPCQHCENAPCESVCPVQATVHDKEGLNVMAYNRCIGTRYCSNNCPYKVRRFNFFNYIKDMPEVIKMAQNPDVTVRSRGVMEKCTYCIQRINLAKNGARLEDRVLEDDEFQTACQQACPTQAIKFGNINDPKSRIFKYKRDDRNYDLLGEFNVRPRTSYLAKIRNPNPHLNNQKEKERDHQ